MAVVVIVIVVAVVAVAVGIAELLEGPINWFDRWLK